MPVELSPEERIRADRAIEYYGRDFEWLINNCPMDKAAYHIGIGIGAVVNLALNGSGNIPHTILDAISPIAHEIIIHGTSKQYEQLILGFDKQYSKFSHTKPSIEAFADWIADNL